MRRGILRVPMLASHAIVSADDLSKLRIDRTLAPIQTRRRRKWWWLAALVVLAAAGAAWFVFSPRATSVQTTPIVTTYPSQQFVVLNSSGYVVAQRKAAIASKASGRLEWLGVAEGSRVKAGDVIARLDARDLAAQLESATASIKVARAAIEQAEAENRDAAASLSRTQDLLKQKFVSQSALDKAKARADRAVAGVASAKAGVAVAEANARNAQVAVDYTHIRAPFDGIILSKSANVGDMVTPFSSAADSKGAVVTMADMSTLEVEADVSESSLSKISRRPAGRDHARRAARRAFSRHGVAHRADGRSRQGDGDDQGALRDDRSAGVAGDERQGFVPVASGDGGTAKADDRGQRGGACASATARRWSSSSATARPRSSR